MTTIEKVQNELNPFFERAEKEKLFFVHGYDGAIFTANELRYVQSQGRYLHGSVNWILQTPQSLYDFKKFVYLKANKELSEFILRCEDLKFDIII